MTASGRGRFLACLALLPPRAPGFPCLHAGGLRPPTPARSGWRPRALSTAKARELHRQGLVREALAKALDAYRTAPTPVTAFETGELLVEAGRLVEARDLLRAIPLLPVSPREVGQGQ